MASGSETDAELAHLSGAELVARLRATYRRDDYEAAARVLSARDRRVAEAEAALAAALADIDALREKYDALLRRPRDEADETAHLAGIAAPSPAHWDEPRVEEVEVKGVEIIDLCSDDDEGAEGPRGDASRVPCKKKRRRRRRRRRKTGLRGPAACADADADADADEDEEDEGDTETLSQRWKRLRQGEPGAAELGKGDGQVQSNSVGSLGNDPQKSSSAREDGPESRTGQMVGTPEDSKVAAFVQGRVVVQPEKGEGGNGGVYKAKVLQQTSGIKEQGDNLYSLETGKVGESNQRGKEMQKKLINPKSNNLLRSSSKCGNKKVGPDMQKRSPLLRQSEEGRIAREVDPFEETRTAAFPPLSIRNLSGPELRGYFFELGGTPPASFIDSKTQKLKGGTGLSKKLVSEEFPKHGEKSNDAGSEKSSSPSRLGEGAEIRVEGASNEEPRVATLVPLITSSLPSTRERSSLPSTITRHWESDGHMITSFIENMELSMQALCALYRQRKIITESTGGQTGNTGLSKSDVYRATKLAKFLLDGDLQGPLKRTAEELVSHDATGPTLLQQVVFNCSKQLFDIYRNKEDPYFC